MRTEGPGSALIEMLLEESDRKSYLAPTAVEKISRALSIPSSRAYAVAGRLEYFSFEPPAERKTSICCGPACALAGSTQVQGVMGGELPGEGTGARVVSALGSPFWHLPIMAELDAGGGRRLVHRVKPDAVAALEPFFEGRKTRAASDLPTRGRSRKALLSRGMETIWARRRTKPETEGAALSRFLLDNDPATLMRMIRGARLPDMVSGHDLSDVLVALEKADGSRGLVVCDTGGAQPENSFGPALASTDPVGVVEGALVAAHAAGADSALVFVPREDLELRGLLAKAIEGFEKAGAWPGVNLSILAAPNLIPCDREIGIASLHGGLTLGEAVARAKYSRRRLWGRGTVMLDVEGVLRLSHLVSGYPPGGRSKGAVTQVVSTGGRVKEPCIAEVPQAITLGDLFAEHSGGLAEGVAIKGIHIGGVYGGPFRPSALRSRLSSINGRLEGAAGGQVLAFDRSTCMVKWAEYFAWLGSRLCCGACVPGRLGPSYALRLLRKVGAGQGELSDLEEIRATIELMKETSLCPQGGRVLNPVAVCIENFTGEFHEHVTEKKCDAGVCWPS